MPMVKYLFATAECDWAVDRIAQFKNTAEIWQYADAFHDAHIFNTALFLNAIVKPEKSAPSGLLK